jgi:hypothetical protein
MIWIFISTLIIAIYFILDDIRILNDKELKKILKEKDVNKINYFLHNQTEKNKKVKK